MGKMGWPGADSAGGQVQGLKGSGGAPARVSQVAEGTLVAALPSPGPWTGQASAFCSRGTRSVHQALPKDRCLLASSPGCGGGILPSPPAIRQPASALSHHTS